MVSDYPRYFCLRLILLPKVLLGRMCRAFNWCCMQTMGCRMCGPGDQKFRNVILLSISFMLVFTAFQTMTNIEKTVLDSIHHDHPSFEGDGFVSLAIIYFFFSLCNWIAPSFVEACGPKRTMIVGSILYSSFIASFLYPNTYVLYVMSGILGFGAAIIWTAQGNYLTLSSTPETMSRNSGVFWAILQCSMFFGNSFVFWQFDGPGNIEESKRTVVFSVLTAISVLGIICLMFLHPIQTDGDWTSNPNQVQESPLSALKKSIRLFTNKQMILLSFTFLYSGIELSFFSGVYSSAVGFTSVLSKRLVGSVGILVGAGEVLGGVAFGLLGTRTVKSGRDPIVLFGFICHIVAFYLIFLNLPNSSTFEKTDETSYLSPPWVSLLMLAAFLLGIGDSCYNTQIFSILGVLFPEESAPAFALFKFTQSAAAALSFFYSSHATLLLQLSILVISGVVGTLTFFSVEWSDAAKPKNNTSIIPSSSNIRVTRADVIEGEQLLGDEDNNTDST